MHVVTRSTPASFIFDTCTDRSVVPYASDLSMKATLAPTPGPNLSKLFLTPSAHWDDWGTL